MKIYEMLDEENGLNIGVLLYFEDEKVYIVELADGLDEWTAPFMFANSVKEGILTIPYLMSYAWVCERVIPAGRQNLDAILNNHGLKEYDTDTFLAMNKGRSTQDNIFLREIKESPAFVEKRRLHNLKDCRALEEAVIMCSFMDGTTRKIDLSTLPETIDINYLLKNKKLIGSCRLGAGGYAACFDESVDIPSWQLYGQGESADIDGIDC